MVEEAGPGPRYILLEQWKKDIHPPLNLLLLHGWMKLGESDGFLMFPSALFSAATLAAVLLLARELSRPAALAPLAGLLFCLSPFSIHFAHYAKGYHD